MKEKIKLICGLLISNCVLFASQDVFEKTTTSYSNFYVGHSDYCSGMNSNSGSLHINMSLGENSQIFSNRVAMSAKVKNAVIKVGYTGAERHKVGSVGIALTF